MQVRGPSGGLEPFWPAPSVAEGSTGNQGGSAGSGNDGRDDIYAQRPGVEPADVLARFARAPHYLTATVGAIRNAGFEVYATGTNPDHYDVQLIVACSEDDSFEPTDEEVRGAAARFMWTAGPLIPNPAYAGEVEDDR